MTKLNRSSVLSRGARIATAIKTHLSGVPSFTFAGVEYTPEELIKLFEDQIAASQNVGSAKGAWLQAIDTEAGLLRTVDNVVFGLREQVRQVFANNPAVLAAFDFTAREARKLPPETYVVAAAKARATRTARGTLGPKKRLAIHGTVPATISIEVAPTATLTKGAGGAMPDATHASHRLIT